MRTAIIGLTVYALGLFTFMPNADARVEHGPAGPTRPGPKAKKCVGNMLFRWCPDGIELNLPQVNAKSKERDRKTTRCRRLKVAYLRHHPTDVPERLERVHGCRRYVLDARFHRKETNNPLLVIANGIWETR